MKLLSRLKRGRRRPSEALVRERKIDIEKKLEVAVSLRENLVHEEYDLQVKDIYDFREGKDAKEVGGFGEVQAVRHKQTGVRYAMKTIPLSRVKSKQGFEFVMKEVDLLKSLDHPNIVRLQEVYVTPSHLHVAMHLIEGGNLAVCYTFEGEERAASIVRQIVRALRYLHDHQIAHRDLKLENILLEKDPNGGGAVPIVKLVDFGLSAIYEDNGVSTDILGSWNYVAPEVIKGKYHPAPADLWSLGVVTYALMSGSLPFDANGTDRIKSRILRAKVRFPGAAWAMATENSRHFVRSLLQKRPELRLTAAAAQQHPWLGSAEEKSQALQKDASFREDVTKSMLEFEKADGMTQLALEVVAHTLDPTQIHLLAEEFDRADKTNNGEISLAEFRRWLAKSGTAKGMTEADVDALFRSIDIDQSGLIHFNEFLAATIQQRELDEVDLRPAFDRLDRSHTGAINVEDVTLTTGARANEEEAAVLVSHFDFNGDGKISFPEFVTAMRRACGSARGNRGQLPLSLRLATSSRVHAGEESKESVSNARDRRA